LKTKWSKLGFNTPLTLKFKTSETVSP